jgi:hypothetical protein
VNERDRVAVGGGVIVAVRVAVDSMDALSVVDVVPVTVRVRVLVRVGGVVSVALRVGVRGGVIVAVSVPVSEVEELAERDRGTVGVCTIIGCPPGCLPTRVPQM